MQPPLEILLGTNSNVLNENLKNNPNLELTPKQKIKLECIQCIVRELSEKKQASSEKEKIYKNEISE